MNKVLILFSLYVPQAIQHVQNSSDALEKAWELANNGTFTPSSIEDGKADAFRHAFWNALGTADFGTHIMKLFADAHEWGESGLAVDMDLYNNQEGREIGDEFSFFSTNDEISDEVLQELFAGRLRYINNGILLPTNQ